MKIYVANLKQDFLRRESIVSQLDMLGLSYEIIQGVDGRQMSSDELTRSCQSPSHFEAAYGRQMLPAEIGCSLSHQAMYEKFLATSNSHAVFLEDDAQLLDGFEEALPALVKQGHDFVLLGYPARTPYETRWAAWIEPIYWSKPVVGNFKVGRSPRRKCFGMVGVLLSRRAAERLLEINTPVTTIADDHPLYSQYIEIKHLRPLVVAENLNLQSSIHQRYRQSVGGLSMRKRASRLLKGVIERLRIAILVCSER